MSKDLKDEAYFYSQNIAKCIQLSDIHINNPQEETQNYTTLKKQLSRYISLIMHPGIITPTRQERCMQLATTAKMKLPAASSGVSIIRNHRSQLRRKRRGIEPQEIKFRMLISSSWCDSNRRTFFYKRYRME